MGLGYSQSETDPCIFRRVVEGKVYLLVVYVDDILIISSSAEVHRLKEAFTKEFRWITLEEGTSHSYLGMQLEFHNGSVEVEMSYYIEKVLQEYNIVKDALLPAKKDLFSVDDQSPSLALKEAKQFHTTVAKLLYLSRRGRPDIITAVGFLCTRVKAPTEQDSSKLLQVLGYLKRTAKQTLLLKPSKIMRVKAFIDASFSTHPYGKSHTGLIVKIGGVPVFCAS